MNENKRWRPSLQLIFAVVSLVSLLLLAVQGRQLVQNEIDRGLSVDLQNQADLVGRNLLERYHQIIEEKRQGQVTMDEVSQAWRELAEELGLSAAPSEALADDSLGVASERPADPELISSAIMTDEAVRFEEVVRREGTPEVIVEAGRSLQWWLEAVERQTGARLTVVDHQGIVLASSTSAWVGTRAGDMQEVKVALGQGRRQAARRPQAWVSDSLNPLRRSNSYQIAVVIPIEYEGYVWGAVHALALPQSVGEFVRDLPALAQWVLGLPFILIPLCLLGAAQFFAVRPLARLQDQAALAADGEDGAELGIAHPRSREVAALSATVAGMAGALREQRDSALQQAERLAHSLWNSLAPAESDAELLRESAERMSPADREEILLRIERSTRDGRRLARQALNLARVGAGAGAGLHGETDIEEVIHEVALALPALEVTCSLPPVALPRVDLEGDAFAEVCRNLLHNAAQAGATKMKIIANPRDRLLELQFRDNGAGVAESLRDTLFDPYVTSRPNEGGHGVGLAHVRATVQAVGGTIDLAPAEGEGSGACLILTLPLAR